MDLQVPLKVTPLASARNGSYLEGAGTPSQPPPHGLAASVPGRSLGGFFPGLPWDWVMTARAHSQGCIISDA